MLSIPSVHCTAVHGIVLNVWYRQKDVTPLTMKMHANSLGGTPQAVTNERCHFPKFEIRQWSHPTPLQGWVVKQS
jgi:hypothetical protein